MNLQRHMNSLDPNARTVGAGIVIALVSVGVLFVIRPSAEPGGIWGDHIFYWSQAEQWIGLEPTLEMSSSTAAILEKYQSEYYYDVSNGLTSQPPYVYRILVPLVSGALGVLVGLKLAFLILTFASLCVMSIFSALTVLKLSNSKAAYIIVAAFAPWLPAIIDWFPRFIALVDPASLAVVATTLWLAVSHRYTAACVVGGVVGAAVKETLIPLALSVAIYAFLMGERKKNLWFLAIVPIVLQFGLRLYIEVPSPPKLDELFVQGDPLQSAHFLLDAFGPMLLLLSFGGLSRFVGKICMAFAPLFLFLAVINTSMVADGARIWLTIWPVILAVGTVGLYKLFPSKVGNRAISLLIIANFAIGFMVIDGRLSRTTLTILMAVTIVTIWCLELAKLIKMNPTIAQSLRARNER